MSENQVVLWEWSSQTPEDRILDIEEKPCLEGIIDINTQSSQEINIMLEDYDIQNTYLNFKIYHVIGLEEPEKEKYFYCFKLSLIQSETDILIDVLPPRIGNVFNLIRFMGVINNLINQPIKIGQLCECSCKDYDAEETTEEKNASITDFKTIRVYDVSLLFIQIIHEIDNIHELNKTSINIFPTVDNEYPFLMNIKIRNIDNKGFCTRTLLGSSLITQILSQSFKERESKWFSI